MHRKKYISEKGRLTIFVYSAIILLLIGIVFIDIEKMLSTPIILVVLLLPIALMLWVWFSTYYVLDDTYLYYHSGPFKGKIEITRIREIIKNKTLWVGYKPALGQKGLIVKYDKWEEIYISPKHKDEFLATLLSHNQTIDVRDAAKT